MSIYTKNVIIIASEILISNVDWCLVKDTLFINITKKPEFWHKGHPILNKHKRLMFWVRFLVKWNDAYYTKNVIITSIDIY